MSAMSQNVSGEVLLASGTFNVSTAAASKTISTSYSGTPTKVLVTKDETSSDVGQVFAWLQFLNIEQTEINSAFSSTGGINICHLIASNGTHSGGYGQNGWTSAIISTSASGITIKSFSNNYKIQPGDYHWYVWGKL